jgi:hypothetical protein
MAFMAHLPTMKASVAPAMAQVCRTSPGLKVSRNDIDEKPRWLLVRKEG